MKHHNRRRKQQDLVSGIVQWMGFLIRFWALVGKKSLAPGNPTVSLAISLSVLDGGFSSSLSVTESIDIEYSSINEKTQQNLPKVVLVVDRDHELRDERAKSPIMESDSECIESEGKSAESDWWVHDVAGNDVETESLTSF